MIADDRNASTRPAAVSPIDWRLLKPDLGKALLAMERIDKLVKDFTSALDAAGVPYAIIGGCAVAAWVSTVDENSTRHTKDVDVLLRRTDHAAASRALESIGLIPEEAGSISIFVTRENPSPKFGVHVIFAGEQLGPTPGVLAPDIDPEFRAPQGFRIVALDALVKMKLIANRLHDRVHIQDLLKLGMITPDIISQLTPELLARLRAVRDDTDWESKPKPEF